MSPIRVLLVDDHPIVRAGMRDLLERASGIEVVGETGTGEEALLLARNLSPDVLLLDMEIQGKGGVEVVQTLKKSRKDIQILAISAHDDRQYIESVLESGACGYLIKDEAPNAIVDAVRGAARGEHGWISRQITAKMFSWSKEEIPSGPGLTDREHQVLKQLVKGKTNQGIGATLGISEKTVEKHMEAIFEKLGVSSRTEAAVWAARESFDKAEHA